MQTTVFLSAMFPVILAKGAELFDACSNSNPCESPSVCYSNICLPPDPPIPVYAAPPFPLPISSPLFVNLPPGLLPDTMSRKAIFLPPTIPEPRPLTRIVPSVSHPVQSTVLPHLPDPIPLSSYRHTNSDSPLSISFQSYPARVPDPVTEPIDQSSIYPLPVARRIIAEELESTLVLPEAKPISVRLTDAPLPPPRPSSPVSMAPSIPDPRPLSSIPIESGCQPACLASASCIKGVCACSSGVDYSPIEGCPLVSPVLKLSQLRANPIAARNPQALPGGECLPSTECTGGSECINGTCLCPPSLVHQGTVCVLRSLYPGLFSKKK